MITFREFIIDNTYNTTQVTWTSAKFEDFIGLELEKFDIVGPVPTNVTPAFQNVNSLVINGATGAGYSSVWLTRILIDNTMANGLYINNVQNLIAHDIMCYQNLGIGIIMTNVLKSQFTNIFVYGGKGLTGVGADTHGITFTGCTNMTVSNLFSTFANGIGVVINNCTDNNFSNVQIKDNLTYGWYELGASDRNIVNGANIKNNTLGSLVQVGVNSVFLNWINATIYRASDLGVKTI